MNLRILLAGLAMAASLLAVLGAGLVRSDSDAKLSSTSRLAPEFELPSVDGAGTLTSASLRGKPAVVSFWATWCPGCREEHETLQRLARELAGRVSFLGISVDDDAAAVRDFLGKHGSAYPVAIDRQSRTASDFGAVGLPTTFLLNANGAVIATLQGPVDPSALRKVLEALATKQTVEPSHPPTESRHP